MTYSLDLQGRYYSHRTFRVDNPDQRRSTDYTQGRDNNCIDPLVVVYFDLGQRNLPSAFAFMRFVPKGTIHPRDLEKRIVGITNNPRINSI